MSAEANTHLNQVYPPASLGNTSQPNFHTANNQPFNPTTAQTQQPVQGYNKLPPPNQVPQSHVPPPQTLAYDPNTYAQTAQTYSQYNYQPNNGGVPVQNPNVSAPTQSYSGQNQSQVYIGAGVDPGFTTGTGYGNQGGNTNPNPYSKPSQAAGYDYSASGQYPTSYQPTYPNY